MLSQSYVCRTTAIEVVLSASCPPCGDCVASHPRGPTVPVQGRQTDYRAPLTSNNSHDRRRNCYANRSVTFWTQSFRPQMPNVATCDPTEVCVRTVSNSLAVAIPEISVNPNYRYLPIARGQPLEVCCYIKLCLICRRCSKQGVAQTPSFSSIVIVWGCGPDRTVRGS